MVVWLEWFLGYLEGVLYEVPKYVYFWKAMSITVGNPACVMNIDDSVVYVELGSVEEVPNADQGAPKFKAPKYLAKIGIMFLRAQPINLLNSYVYFE